MDIWWWLSFLGTPVVLLLVARWLWQQYFQSQCDPASSLPLPPGDMGWPLVGEMIYFIFLTLTGGDFFAARKKKYGDMFKTHVFGKPTVRVVGSANIKPVLLGEHTHVRSQWPSTLRSLIGSDYTLATASGDAHKLLRKRVLQAFSKSALEGYTEPLQHIIMEELELWCTRGHILVYEEAITLVQRASLEVLIGFTDVTPGEKANFAEHLNKYTAGFFSAGWEIPGTAFYQAKKSRKYLVDLLRKQVSKKQTDLHFRSAMSLIQDVHQDTGHVAEEEEVLEIMLELFFAGYLTVRSAITSVVRQLGRHPEVVQKVKDELDQHSVFLDKGSSLTLDKVNQLTYVNGIVKEVLRMDPPIGGGFRTLLRTMEIQGYQIPKGWTIVYSVKDSHDSSPEYKDPSSFNPDRWAELEKNEQLPTCLFLTFGAGARACAGKEFAKLILRIMTVVLVRMCEWKLESEVTVMKHFPNAHPADGLPTVFNLISQESTDETNSHELKEDQVRQRHVDA